MDKIQALKQYFGHSSFREGQSELTDAILSGRDAVGIMPTGAGKSICYQLPAVIMEGVTIVVSPLISLMKDQVNTLNQTGIPAAYLNSSLTERQFRLALSRAYNGAYKIIYAAPERLLTEGFLRLCTSINIAMVTIDEAHCISQWGQDFRPSYLQICDFIDRFDTRPVVSAFTATATANVRNDILRILRLNDPLVITTGFDRKNLYFGVEHPRDKLRALTTILDRNEGKSGIVYCATRKNVEQVCASLRYMGYSATRYHAGLEDEERFKNQEDFLYDRDTIMVATNAFGMGIDKSNVSFVVHYNMPKNIESYYQEAGRAGRDGEEAECIILYEKKDVSLASWMIDHSEPNELLTEKQQELIRERDKERLRQMTFYSTTDRCLRRFILDYFGDRRSCECKKCSSCCPETQIEPRQTGSRRSDGRATEYTRKGSVSISGSTAKRTAPPIPRSPLTESDNALFDALKALRAKRAKTAGVPAFVVFSDATLRDMCRRKPTTMSEFLDVSGVGDTKAKRYGKDFTAEIRRFLSGGEQAAVPEKQQSGTSTAEREKPERKSGSPASTALRRELLMGKSLGQIAKEQGMTIDEVMEQLKGLR